MNEVYSNSFLNTTLARWSRPSGLRAPQLDCAGCAKPAKCCAFQPFVPNFLLGGWLENALVLPEIENVYFTPIGAVATPEYRARHVASAEPGVELLCGFFDRTSRSCTMWNFRPGECSTYFCDDARLSEEREDVRQKSFDLEVSIAQMALVELGFSPVEIGAQVDHVNGMGVSMITSSPELLMMYKKAWNWSKILTREMVESWME